MTSGQTERRREARLEKDGDVTWRLADGDAWGDAALVDVSAGGACVTIAEPASIAIGTVVALSSARLPLPFTARVLWVRPAGGDLMLCGLEFPPDAEWASWLAAHDRALRSIDAAASIPPLDFA